MIAFIEAGQFDHLAPGRGTAAAAGNNTIALFKIDGVIYAIEAWCLRCGACLADGNIDGAVVSCHGCDWRYDVPSGAVEGVPALRLSTFEVNFVDGRVIVTDV